MLKKAMHMVTIAATVIVAACSDMSRTDEALYRGLAVGAILGYITAEAFEADDDWVVVAVLVGATAGTLVARHRITNRCAYAHGDGRYYVTTCPR